MIINKKIFLFFLLTLCVSTQPMYSINYYQRFIRNSIVIGSIFGIIGIAWLVTKSDGCFSKIAQTFRKISNTPTTETIKQTYKLISNNNNNNKEPNLSVIHELNGTITVTSHSDPFTSVSIIYQGENEKEIQLLKQLTLINLSDCIELNIKQRRNYNLSRSARIDFDIVTPQDTWINILETDYGDICARGIWTIKKAQSNNGNILLHNINSATSAKTSNGNIKINSLTGNKNTVTAETSNGDITLANIQGNAKAHTSNGPINITTCDNYTGKLTYKTSNGSVYINGKKVRKYS